MLTPWPWAWKPSSPILSIQNPWPSISTQAWVQRPAPPPSKVKDWLTSGPKTIGGLSSTHPWGRPLGCPPLDWLAMQQHFQVNQFHSFNADAPNLKMYPWITIHAIKLKIFHVMVLSISIRLLTRIQFYVAPIKYFTSLSSSFTPLSFLSLNEFTEFLFQCHQFIYL